MGAGRLLLIGTPIGNLNDLSPRAIAALKECELLLCEDTRHSQKLLSHFGIRVPLESFHEHNEDSKVARIAEAIEAGKVVGLISDAGTPVISDPGFSIVRELRRRQLPVEPVPGPFAGVLALISSGIAPLPFAFFGFAPHKRGERLDFYRGIGLHAMTAIVYESPLRVVESLRDALEALGDVEATVAREITKFHEELIHGTLTEVIAELENRDAVRGEITIVFAAALQKASEADPAQLVEEFNRLRNEGMKRTDAIRLLAGKHGIRKNDLYKMLSGD
jgi:16S rRNA (cytidine1402-2'-O)-methyltransferase